MRILLCLTVIVFGSSASVVFNKNEKRYGPNWNDLDKRPLPRWYDEAKVGIFLHWGVYCVPGVVSEWFWFYWKSGGNTEAKNFMKNNYPPGFSYQDFAPKFTAEFFDPMSWANLFAKSGAKYIVLTSKHHEGFSMFPSKRSYSWNSVEVGPKRDIVGELSHAVRQKGLKFGVYHSLYEWYNPIYLEDKKSNFATNNYVRDKMIPDLKQLVQDYKPSVIWSDGDWEAYDTYWLSTTILAWLYNDSPIKDEVVVNDRWGKDLSGKHGDFYNFADRFNNRTLQHHKWENAFTLDRKSWGFRRNLNLEDVLSISELITELVTSVSCGGNVLINVGPTKEGTIPVIFQERLLSLGTWLEVNGEAIYKSSPWISQNDTYNGDVWYTCTKAQYDVLRPTAVPDKANVTSIYAITLKWPANNILKLRDISPYLHSGNYKVELLGNEGTHLNIGGQTNFLSPLGDGFRKNIIDEAYNVCEWWLSNGLAEILLPDMSNVKSKDAWTIRFRI